MNEKTIRAAKASRYRVFSLERGVKLESEIPGIDHDEIDDYYSHLVVCDISRGKILAP